MDKHELTQVQWDEMVTTQLKETEKALDSGTVDLIPFKEVSSRLMRHIEEIAEKEHAKAALSYETSQLYESPI